MELQPHQKKSLADCLRKVSERTNAPVKCPMCGNTEFDFKPSEFVMMSLGEPGNKTIAVDTSLKVGAIVCKNCRHVDLFTV